MGITTFKSLNRLHFVLLLLCNSGTGIDWEEGEGHHFIFFILPCEKGFLGGGGTEERYIFMLYL